VIPLLLALTVAAAPGVESDKYLSRARVLVNDAEYARAQRVIARGLARPGLSGGLLSELFALDGECALARGRTKSARAAFVKVLTIRPGFRFPSDRSPKLRGVLEEVRKVLIEAGEVARPYEPAHTPLGAVRSGEPGEARVVFRGPGKIDRVVLYARALGASAYTAVDASFADGGWNARVPAALLNPEVDDAAVEYWLAGFDQGERVVVVGASDRPFRFLVLSDEALAAGEEDLADPFPVVPVAVGAAVVGVVLVGAAIGTAIALSPKTGRAVVGVTAP
jgi:hypothetical protein